VGSTAGAFAAGMAALGVAPDAADGGLAAGAGPVVVPVVVPGLDPAGSAGGDTTAAIVPPKIVTRPITASAIMPVATTELVLTDTRGSIQSAR